MVKDVKKVVVLGASGTIGSLTGGIIAQAGIEVYFLSRTPEGSQAGLKRAINQARSEVISQYIKCGDYDHLLKTALKDADLIIESVTEDAEVKRNIYERIEQYLKPDTIIGTTTSSLPLTALAKGRSEIFKRNFLSTHFYNPPGKMLACETCGTDDTDPEVYNFMKDFLKNKLHRVVIPVNNIPGFAGNRIAFVLFNKITALVEQHGVEMMDYLIGPYTGRLMPPLATIDLVGLDIHKAIIQSLKENTHDGMHDSLIIPEYINKMVEKRLLGNKTKSGFYKKLESGKEMFIDPDNCEYIPEISPHVKKKKKAKSFIHLGMYREAFETIKAGHSVEADIVKQILCTYIAYSYSLIGEVTKPEFGISGIDKVMTTGFHWAAPSMIVTMLGGKAAAIDLLNKMGITVPMALQNDSSTTQEVANLGKYFIAH